MKKIYYLLSVALLSVFVSSCKEDAPVTPPEPDELTPEIALSATEVEAPADGGVFAIHYSVDNAVEGVDVEVVLPDDSWVEVDNIDANIIRLNAERNTTDAERTMQLTLSYEGAESENVTISQAAWIAPLAIEVVDVDDLSVTFTVTTTDPELTWIPLMAPKEYFDSFASQEAIVDDDKQYIINQAMGADITVSEYIEKLLQKGTMENLVFNKLTPSTTYTLYAYGFTADGECTTDIVSVEVTTDKPYDGPMEFDINVTEKDFILTIDITPSHDGVAYFWDACTESVYNENGGKMPDVATALIERQIEDYLYYGDITSRTEYYNWYSSRNAMTYWYEVWANTRYIIYAFKWNEDCKVVGDVAYVWYDTAKLSGSSNEITLEVSNPTQSTFDVTTTTTNNDPYVVLAEPVEWCGWNDMTDDEVFEYVMSSYGTFWLPEYVCNGSLTDARFYELDPDTEYAVIAFGYEAGMRTTDIVRTSISTLPACDPDDCEFTFNVEWVKSNSAYITITPSDLSHYYHWMVYDPETTEAEAKTMIRQIIQNDYYGSYVEFSYDALVRGEAAGQVDLLAPDSEYKIGVVIMDPENNQFLSGVTFSENFRTAEMQYADIKVRCAYDLYYDGDAMAAADPAYSIYQGHAVVPLRIEIQGAYDTFYYTIINYQEGLDDPEQYPDYLLYEYLYNGVYYAQQIDFRCPWDTEVMLTAVALDSNGYYSPVYREVVSFSKDGASANPNISSVTRTSARSLSEDIVNFYLGAERDMPVVNRYASDERDERFSTKRLNTIRGARSL